MFLGELREQKSISNTMKGLQSKSIIIVVVRRKARAIVPAKYSINPTPALAQ